MKLLALLGLLTAIGIFALLLGLQLAGEPLGDYESVPLLAAVAAFLALAVAAIQIAALGILRLLPWEGPSLKVEGGDPLRRVFE